MGLASDSNREADRFAYFLGKLQSGVHILTTHPGDARTRLRAAWTPFVLAGGKVPSHLKREYTAIKHALTARRYLPSADVLQWEHSEDIWTEQGWAKADSPYGRMVHTTGTMRNRTASQLASRILDLSLMWKDWLDYTRR